MPLNKKQDRRLTFDSFHIRGLDYDSEVRPLKSRMQKAGVTCANPPDTTWIGAIQDGDVIGVVALTVQRGEYSARFKSDWVSAEWRGNGIYDKLFQFRLSIARRLGVKTVTAFSAPGSFNTFKRYGFLPVGWPRGKRGIRFMKGVL